MSEISILIFLITTLGGLIYSFGRKSGKEKVENENNHKRRQIANQLQISPANETMQQTDARSEKPQRGSYESGKNRGPNAQTERGNEPLHEDIWLNLSVCQTLDRSRY